LIGCELSLVNHGKIRINHANRVPPRLPSNFFFLGTSPLSLNRIVSQLDQRPITFPMAEIMTPCGLFAERGSSVTSRAAKPGSARLQVVNTRNPQFISGHRVEPVVDPLRSAVIRAGGHLAVMLLLRQIISDRGFVLGRNPGPPIVRRTKKQQTAPLFCRCYPLVLRKGKHDPEAGTTASVGSSTVPDGGVHMPTTIS
jgi:hypothetical protein